MHFINLDTGTDQLLAQKRAGVGVITLSRPKAKNALSPKLSPALRKMIQQMGEDDDIGAVIITGAGKAFCAGGDVKGMGISRGPVLTADQRLSRLLEGQRQLTGALVNLRKPVIAAIPGPAVGAGLSLALACDIRIGSLSSFVTTGYARVGLSGDYGISSLLTRAVGSGRARELMKDNLDDALVLNFDASLDSEAPRLIEAMTSSDHKEAVRAFVEKRKPVFGGN